jgi:hypothetical protein
MVILSPADAVNGSTDVKVGIPHAVKRKPILDWALAHVVPS